MSQITTFIIRNANLATKMYHFHLLVWQSSKFDNTLLVKLQEMTFTLLVAMQETGDHDGEGDEILQSSVTAHSLRPPILSLTCRYTPICA